MKIFAGGKFQTRKPSRLPTSSAQRRGDEQLPDEQRGGEEDERADARDAGRQAVHVVEKVEGVGHAGDPQDGHD